MTYAKMERELCAVSGVMFALNELEKYVLGKEFLLMMTDNITLQQYVEEV